MTDADMIQGEGNYLPPNELPAIAETAPLPISYERARAELATCEHVDECKDWADKAMAMASYARQADDKTLMNSAMRIRARAIERGGGLLREYNTPPGERNPTGDNNPKGGHPPLGLLTQREAAEQAGLSENQEKTWIRVANIPPAVLDELIESDTPPTITELAEIGTKHKEPPLTLSPEFVANVDDARRMNYSIFALAEKCREYKPLNVVNGTHQHELQKVKAEARVVSAWLLRYIPELGET